MISGPGLVCLAYASYPLLRIGVVFTYKHLRDCFHTEEGRNPMNVLDRWNWSREAQMTFDRLCVLKATA